MHRAKQCARWAATSVAACLCSAALAAAAPTTGPATAPVRGSAARPATRPTTQPAHISLNFKDTPLDTVLDSLSQTAGFEVIKDGAVDTRVTLISKQPLTEQEAITMLNAALRGNGFTVVREGKILRVIARDKAKKGNVPVHFGNDPNDIAESDELITQVIPIQNVSATKLRDDLKPMMPPDADVAANDGSNSIIITDTSTSVRRLVQMIAKLDEHEAETSEIRIIPLKFASAATVAKMIDTFFKSSGGGPQMPMPGMPMMQPGQPQPPRGGSERHGQTVITASDDRTNTLLVMASTSTLKTIEQIVKSIDTGEPHQITETTTKFFPLQYADAEATAKLINDVYKAQSNNDSPYYFIRFNNDDQKKDKINAAFDARTNTVIVTGPVHSIPDVEKLIKQLDSNPVAAAALKVFHLKYAEAFDVQKLLEDMFKPKDNTRNSPFLYIFDSAPPQQAKGVQVNISSDDRTNTVIVSAPIEMMKAIEKVVTELDADPATEDTLFIYHLRNGQAQNLEYVLNVLFGNISNNGQNNQQNGQNQPNQNNQNRNGNNGFNNFGNNNGNNNNGFNNRRNNNNNRNNRPGGQMNQNIQQAFNDLTGKVFVVANPDTNSLMVTTARRYEKQVRQIIDDLDRPVPQVLIKVLVVEVTHDNGADLGVDFSILNQRPSGKGLVVGQTLGNSASYATNGGLAISLLEGNLQATLHLLATQNKLDVLSRPYILASDNQEASIMVGQLVPIIQDVRVTDTGQLIATPTQQSVGIMLDVTPHINPDGLVILDVAPTISELAGSNVTIGPGITSPVINQRNAQSRVGIQNDETIVIGGLMQDQKTTTVSKVPILGDIPLIGGIFARNQVDKTKTELLIFLTPHVAQIPESLRPMSQDEMHGTVLTPNAVSPGTFQEHMKGLQRGELPQTQPTQPISPVHSIDLSEGHEKHNSADDQSISQPATQPSGGKDGTAEH